MKIKLVFLFNLLIINLLSRYKRFLTKILLNQGARKIKFHWDHWIFNNLIDFQSFNKMNTKNCFRGFSKVSIFKFCFSKIDLILTKLECFLFKYQIFSQRIILVCMIVCEAVWFAIFSCLLKKKFVGGTEGAFYTLQ